MWKRRSTCLLYTSEIRQLLDDAQADLADIDKAVKEIKTSSVRQDAQALYATGARILTYLEENPDKIKLARCV